MNVQRRLGWALLVAAALLTPPALGCGSQSVESSRPDPTAEEPIDLSQLTVPRRVRSTEEPEDEPEPPPPADVPSTTPRQSRESVLPPPVEPPTF